MGGSDYAGSILRKIWHISRMVLDNKKKRLNLFIYFVRENEKNGENPNSFWSWISLRQGPPFGISHLFGISKIRKVSIFFKRVQKVSKHVLKVEL